MIATDFLAAEWKPAMGCTEPAAVAWAASLAREQATGAIQSVHLRCDARTYKNCYAVGLPNSNRNTGLLWALALGACLPDGSRELSSLEGNTPESIEQAGLLISKRKLTVDVDRQQGGLYIDVTIQGETGSGRAVIEQEHNQLVRLEKNGEQILDKKAQSTSASPAQIREELKKLGIAGLMDVARQISQQDRERLQQGVAMNLAIARHGLSLLPAGFVTPTGLDSQTRLSRLVAAGVFARMGGEGLPVMTLAGSGNKGITTSIPIFLWGRESGHPESKVEEAMAFGFLMASLTTYQLGTLSALCGGAIAAGIGIASALVMLEGGSAKQVDLAVSNMVGNVAGMVCDGAKIGCALKTMTGVDSAFRAAHLALSGIGIPATDGIVGRDGEESLDNLGRLAQKGMADVDEEILSIMQDKLRA